MAKILPVTGGNNDASNGTVMIQQQEGQTPVPSHGVHLHHMMVHTKVEFGAHHRDRVFWQSFAQGGGCWENKNSTVSQFGW